MNHRANPDAAKATQLSIGSRDLIITVRGDDRMGFNGSYMVIGGGGSSSKSVSGTVPETYTVSGSMVSTSFQKKSDGPGLLIVTIFRGGQLVRQESTRAPFGVVTLAGK